MRSEWATNRAWLHRVAAAVLVTAVAVAAPAAAAEPDVLVRARPGLSLGSYFPLQPGFRWVYQAAGAIGEPRTWEVRVLDRPVPSTPLAGRVYLPLVGYFDSGQREVRSDPFSNVFERSGDARDHLWYLLGAPVGTSWTLALAQPELSCLAGARLTIGARDEVVTVPAGEFHNVVRVDYSGSQCADAGITTEWFAPGVGLVRRSETTIAGALISDLVTAELGQVVWPRAAYETSLLLTSPTYVHNLMPPVGPDAVARVRGALVVRNRSDEPVELVFGGCRSVTLELRDQSGSLVLETRADDGGCCACDNLVTVTLVRDALVLPFSFTLGDSTGTPLPDGRYALTATLDSLGSEALRSSARAGITVQSVH
jgi:hypothetical protein